MLAYISYRKLWESAFDNFVSKKDKVQDLNFNQLKLEVYDTYSKNEKTALDSEPVIDKPVRKKASLDEKLAKI